MDKNIIIFGTTEIAAWIIRAIQSENNASVIAVTVEKQYVNQCEFEGYPIIPFEDLDNHFDMSKYQLLLAIGYNQMNNVRQRIYTLCKNRKYKIYTYVSNRANVDCIKNIGEGCIVMPGTFIGPHVKLGICNIVNVGACISHSIILGDFNFIAGNVVFGGNVLMENNCFVGINATIINNLHIAQYTFIGAAALINKNTEEYGVYTTKPTTKRDDINVMEIINKVM